MGGAGKILTKADVVEINRRMINTFGGVFFAGDDNLVNPGSLDYVLEEIGGTLFGVSKYPSLVEKVALIGWRIIIGHIFHDGNKRTGMEACRVYLELNGYDMKIDSEVVNIAKRIAKNDISYSEFVSWIRERIEVVK
jgi:death-on-curing protein